MRTFGVVRSKSVWKAAIGLFSAVVRWFGAVEVLPKIAHTRPLIGEPIAEPPLKVLGKVGRTPQSQISINLSHGDKHIAVFHSLLVFYQSSFGPARPVATRDKLVAPGVS